MQSTTMRFLKLIGGLYIYGWGLALMVNAKIGIPPWDVLAQGISVQTKLSYGISSVIVSALVLLAWIPLRQRPGLGTVLNAVLIGLFADTVFPLLPNLVGNYALQLGSFALGMLLVALATGLYISSHFGSGPRDGLMVGTQQLTGWPFWIVRTMFEVTVLTIGWLMGGQVREGTLIFAVCIGYLMQTSMRFFKVPMRKDPKRA
ncbi:MAG: YczE/YyaS/YitT family protein [Micrococcales bacterium]